MVEQGPGRGRGVFVGAPDIDSLYPLYTPSPRPLLRRARRREQRASAFNHCPAYEMHAGRRSLVGRLSKRGMPEKRSEVSASEEAPSECGSPDGSPATKLDVLATYIASIAVRSDEVVASLYPPQESSVVTEEMKLYLAGIQDLKSSLMRIFFPSISALAQPSGQAEQSTGVNNWKWYGTCFEQIERASNGIS